MVRSCRFSRGTDQHLSSDQNTGLPFNGLQTTKVISINQSEFEVHNSLNFVSHNLTAHVESRQLCVSFPSQSAFRV